MVRRDQRTGLPYMTAEHLAQSRVQKMRRRVVPHRIRAVLGINARSDLISDGDAPFTHAAVMDD